jgi:hypothetical protein
MGRPWNGIAMQIGLNCAVPRPSIIAPSILKIGSAIRDINREFISCSCYWCCCSIPGRFLEISLGGALVTKNDVAPKQQGPDPRNLLNPPLHPGPHNSPSISRFFSDFLNTSLARSQLLPQLPCSAFILPRRSRLLAPVVPLTARITLASSPPLLQLQSDQPFSGPLPSPYLLDTRACRLSFCETNRLFFDLPHDVTASITTHDLRPPPPPQQ